MAKASWLVIFAMMAAVSASPVVNSVEASTKAVHKNKGSLLKSENQEINPKNNPDEKPDLTEYEEIDEKDIAVGTWVLAVDELEQKEAGESMDTANNIVFRPLFRYREKQNQNANRRIRRRYYVPRRSYKKRYSNYYRPYRSANYYPYKYYGSYYG